MADKEHFYHCCITSHFLVFLGFSGFVSLCKFLLSGITWFELFTLVLYITVVEWHVKSRRFSACLDRRFTRYSGRRPSYIILSSPYTCAQFRIVLVHFFVASKVARYSAFKRAVSLGNTLLCRFSFR